MAIAPPRGSDDTPTRNSIMEEAGQKLKRARERLGLTYRDVEEATAQIADAHNNPELVVPISRLADIENRGTLPSLYRLYSLCAVYLLDMSEVLIWYGISLETLPSDARLLQRKRTSLVNFKPREEAQVQLPMSLEPGLDLSKTTFLSRFVQRWGRVPLMLLADLDLKNRLYGLIGFDDWSMFPLIPPGSLVVIDDGRRKILSSAWRSEFERPIYFLEHRDGYECAWCSLRDDQLTMQWHPASSREPVTYQCPNEIEVLGQVTQVVMTLEPSGRRRPARVEPKP